MRKYGKPHYIEVTREDIVDSKKRIIRVKAIKKLLNNEPFGVLATNTENESYTSLISFVTNDDATFLAFSTPIDTRKYRMIEKNRDVSLLIDNRSANLEDINQIAAITAIGKAHILKDTDELKNWSQRLIEKHSYLVDFIRADTSAIIVVEIKITNTLVVFKKCLNGVPGSKSK